MANSTSTERNDKLFDAVLKVAAEEAMVQRMETMPNREELMKQYPRSDIFDKKMAKVIGRHDRAEKRKQTMRYFYRAAAVFAIFFTVSVTTLMSVEASRNFIINRLSTIISFHDDHVAFEFRAAAFENEEIGFTLGYLPYGFEVAGINALTFLHAVNFSDNAGRTILVTKIEADGTGAAFGEGDVRGHIITSVRGREAHLFQAVDETEYSMLMWLYGNYAMQVTSNVGIGEMVRIAENLQLR